MTDMTLMERETRESPAVAMRLVDSCSAQLAELGARLRTLEPRLILAAGRGSSDAAALLAKYVFETRLGLPTVSVAPSVHSIYGAKLKLAKALVLAISQSGRSPDLVAFCRAATGPDVLRLAMVNDVASPLTTAVDVTLPLMAGPETSVAATKSCIAAMTLVQGLVGHWRPESGMAAAFDRTASVLEESIAADWSGADAFLDGDGPVYVVGRGPGLAIAAEAALKLKETSGLHAESISAAEIRQAFFDSCAGSVPKKEVGLRLARKGFAEESSHYYRGVARTTRRISRLCSQRAANSRPPRGQTVRQRGSRHPRRLRSAREAARPPLSVRGFGTAMPGVGGCGHRSFLIDPRAATMDSLRTTSCSRHRRCHLPPSH